MMFKRKKDKTKKEVKEKFPVILKLIVIVGFVMALLYLAISVAFFINTSIISQIPPFDSNPELSKNFSYSLGTLLIFVSLAYLAITIGLIFRKNWARITFIVFSLINVIGGIFSLVEQNYISLINLTFNLLIIIYLIFSKKTKTLFKKKDSKTENNSK